MCESLYIFVEDNNDKRFFERIKGIISECTGIKTIFIVPHVQKPDKLINGYISKAKKTPNNTYLFVSDRDSNHFPCMTKIKDKLSNKYKSLDIEKIVIVEEEIESWYFSGLKKKSLLNNCEDLDYNCSKEEFDNAIPEHYEKIDFLNEILKYFDSKLAINNNNSFNYFIQKLNIINTH
ncbi:hypothetical protein [Methanobrevibacter filiformis]|nr:hypothetical protein [Methanobrevibacter filiformis]